MVVVVRELPRTAKLRGFHRQRLAPGQRGECNSSLVCLRVIGFVGSYWRVDPGGAERLVSSSSSKDGRPDMRRPQTRASDSMPLFGRSLRCALSPGIVQSPASRPCRSGRAEVRLTSELERRNRSDTRLIATGGEGHSLSERCGIFKAGFLAQTSKREERNAVPLRASSVHLRTKLR